MALTATKNVIDIETRRKTFGRLTYDPSKNKWAMDDIPPNVAIRLKQLFQKIEKTRIAPFYFDDTPETCADLQWFMERYPLKMDSADENRLQEWRDLFYRREAELEAILQPDYQLPEYVGYREGQSLRDYQSQAVEVLRIKGGLLLGDEVGLGKTFACCGAMLMPGALPAVVVVEPHVQHQWQEVIESFTTLRTHCITTTKAYPLPVADVYIFRYSNVFGWSDVFASMDIGLAAWDEVQSLRRGCDEMRGTAKGRTSKILANKARFRMGLTATPIYNYGAEIFNIMQFIDDTALGDDREFRREWCGWGDTVRDPEALGAYLREQHVFLRRRRSDVGRELPPVNKIVDYVDYDSEVVRSAEELARALALKATEGSFVERGQAARELDVLIRHKTGIAKARMVARYVRVLLEAGEPVLLMGWHRDVYDIWNEELGDDFAPAMYTGTETASQKLMSEKRFVEGHTDLMIMSLRSGAGLDSLQDRCSTVVFGELDWSPGIHHQVIGRLDRDRRDGKRNKVMAIFLVTDEGSDPPMMEVLGLKASQAQAINDPGLGVQRTHSDESHLKKLIQRYLKEKK